jgi:hypothetical protein
MLRFWNLLRVFVSLSCLFFKLGLQAAAVGWVINIGPAVACQA